MNRTIEAILRISSKLGDMRAFGETSKKLAEVDEKAKAYNRSQGKIARADRAMNAAMMRYVGPAAVAYGFKRAAQAAGDFEESLFAIEKKSGASAKEMKKIKDEILDLGQQMPVSLDEIAAAYERGAAAGIPLDELKRYAQLTVQVADAWDMSAEAVANAFAGFNAGMGVPISEVEGLADAINYLADSGISDESDIVQFLDRVGASAKNVGLTARETAALGSALINLKMPPEIAARATDTLFGKLMAPENLSKKSSSALTRIVGDIEAFKKVMADNPLDGLVGFFEKMEGMTGQERISVLGALMGEGFDDEVARMVGGLDEIKRNIQLVKDTAAYEGSIGILSERRLELFNSKLQQTQNLFREIAVASGEIVLPALNDGLGVVNDQFRRQAAIDRWKEKNGKDGILWGYSGEELNRIARSEGFVPTGDKVAKAALEATPRAYEVLGHSPARPVSPTPSHSDFASVNSGLDGLRVGEGVPELTDLVAKLEQAGSGAGQELAQGGNEAGDAIKAAAGPTGQEIGSSATSAMQSGASAVGQQIGAAAAAALRAELSSITTGWAARVRADVGRASSPTQGPQ